MKGGRKVLLDQLTSTPSAVSQDVVLGMLWSGGHLAYEQRAHLALRPPQLSGGDHPGCRL